MSVWVDISITATYAPRLSYPQSSSSSLEGALGTVDPRMLSLQQPVPDVTTVPSHPLQRDVVRPPLLKHFSLVNHRLIGFCFRRSSQGYRHRTTSDHDTSNAYESRFFHKRVRSIAPRIQAYASICSPSTRYDSWFFQRCRSRTIQNVQSRYDYSASAIRRNEHSRPQASSTRSSL